jgi:pimeloyl-ACP methyl ester carboxylesterase
VSPAVSTPAVTAASRRCRSLVLVAMVAVLSLSGCSQDTDRRLVDGYVEEMTEQPFYTLPSPLPAGAPGGIVRTEELASAPAGTVAWRVLYHSTDVVGTAIVVSGVIVAPDTPAPAGGRPVVGWGHPTTGTAPKCAPSNGIDPFDLIEGMGDLINAGYAVAAADYPGLGVPGPNSYLVGTSEGNSVLDAVRAAGNLPETGVTSGSDVLLWGHSQGGQAVLFAAQDAPTYAPELQVRGVAVAAPAAELGALLNDDIVDASGVSLGSYAFAAYQTVYGATTPGLSLDQILTPEGAAATPGMAELCLIGQNKELHALADPLVGNYLKADPTTTQPWATLLAENTPGAKPVAVPLFVAQGDADTLVLPAATEQFVTGACTAGDHVIFKTYQGASHGTVATVAMPDVLTFFQATREGTPPTSTC